MGFGQSRYPQFNQGSCYEFEPHFTSHHSTSLHSTPFFYTHHTTPPFSTPNHSAGYSTAHPAAHSTPTFAGVDASTPAPRGPVVYGTLKHQHTEEPSTKLDAVGRRYYATVTNHHTAFLHKDMRFQH